MRVTARADDHVVLGNQAVGRGVAELAAALGLAIGMGARLADVAGTVHARPTLGEAFAEASLKPRFRFVSLGLAQRIRPSDRHAAVDHDRLPGAVARRVGG